MTVRDPGCRNRSVVSFDRDVELRIPRTMAPGIAAVIPGAVGGRTREEAPDPSRKLARNRPRVRFRSTRRPSRRRREKRQYQRLGRKGPRPCGRPVLRCSRGGYHRGCARWLLARWAGRSIVLHGHHRTHARDSGRWWSHTRRASAQSARKTLPWRSSERARGVLGGVETTAPHHQSLRRRANYDAQEGRGGDP